MQTRKLVEVMHFDNQMSLRRVSRHAYKFEALYIPVKSGTGGIVVISDTVCCNDLGLPANSPQQAEDVLAAAVPADRTYVYGV